MEYYAEFWHDRYWHVGDERYVRLCARKDSPIVKVALSESESGEYWAWQDTGSDKYVMFQPHPGLFDMQFAYGAKAEVDRGRGRIVRLNIEIA